MSESRSSRRSFLKKGATATALAATAGGLTARVAGADTNDRFVGAVQSVSSDRFQVAVDGSGLADVVLDRGAQIRATITSDGSDELSAFRVGDRVALTGSLSGDVLQASSVRIAFDLITGTVESDDGETVSTSAGDVVIPPNERGTLPARFPQGATLVAAVSGQPNSAGRPAQAFELR